MKKLSVNHNDASFENRHRFEELLTKIKRMGGSIRKNSKQTLLLGMMSGCILLSTNNIYKIGANLVGGIMYYNELSKSGIDIGARNDELISKLLRDAILIANVPSEIEQDYYFKDNNIYNKEGDIVTLNETDKPIYFINCNIDEETLKNTKLSSALSKQLSLDMSSATEDCINHFPTTLEELSLNRCNYITNLNGLAERCPNLKSLYINSAAALSDLSFIYELSNLENLQISDSVYINEDILHYLNEKGITHNLTEQDIINSEKIDEIISKTIDTDMNDLEKIKRISLYVLNNVEYEESRTIESNRNPLGCVLKDGKGVCASYAYLTNVLLNKAGIRAFEVTSDDHGWNIVDLDGKYYYIDTTNMDGSWFYNFLLEKLNITKYYMVDTENTFRTGMDKPSAAQTIMPSSLIKDIENGRSDKDLFEKYGGQVGNVGVLIASILSGIATVLGPPSFIKVIQTSPDLIRKLRQDYNEEKEKDNGHKKR